MTSQIGGRGRGRARPGMTPGHCPGRWHQGTRPWAEVTPRGRATWAEPLGSTQGCRGPAATPGRVIRGQGLLGSMAKPSGAMRKRSPSHGRHRRDTAAPPVPPLVNGGTLGTPRGHPVPTLRPRAHPPKAQKERDLPVLGPVARPPHGPVYCPVTGRGAPRIQPWMPETPRRPRGTPWPPAAAEEPLLAACLEPHFSCRNVPRRRRTCPIPPCRSGGAANK